MNFKIDSFKIRINSYEFQEILKFVKFEFSIYAAIIPTLSFFTGRMPFLLPNQQCQSTEGMNVYRLLRI